MSLFSSMGTQLRRVWLHGVAALLLAAVGPLAHAATVQYEQTDLGNSLWRYQYTVDGSAPDGGFDGLTVYFDAGLFSAISALTAPAAWDGFVAQPDAGLASDGFVDLLHLGGLINGAIAPFSFTVDVRYTGLGAPGSQRFELYVSEPFAIVADGVTQSAAQNVPEPEGLALALLAFGCVAVVRRRSHNAR